MYIYALEGVFIVFKKIVSLVMVLCLVAGMLGVVPVFASDLSGECGDNVTWELSADLTTLTVKGSGAIRDYSYDDYAGWYNSAMYSVTTLVIEEGITRIGNYAFYSLRYLKSITIPDSVKEIGECAFSDCWAVEDIYLGSGVESIGYQAFAACQTLTELVIPDNVKTIYSMAFGCIKLKSIHIGSGVESIAVRAFETSGELEEITVSEDNESYLVEDGVLYDINKTTLLKYVPNNNSSEFTVPSTVSDIHAYAFAESKYLTKVTVPDTVTEVGMGAFLKCSALTSVVYNADVDSLAGSLFYKCSSLESVFIPKGITTIDGYAFYNCDSLTDVYFGGTESEWADVGVKTANSSLASALIHYECSVTDDMTSYTPDEYFVFKDGVITDYTGSFDKVVVPKAIGGVTVTTIGENAFDCANATKIVLPDTIETIKIKAFMSSDITSMVIPESVKTIEHSAFQYCYYLKSIDFLTEQLEEIKDSTFYYCTTLEEITLPDSVKTVGDNAFMYCDALKTVTLGKNLESITGQAFQSTRSLENIYLADENKHFMVVNNALCQKDPVTEVNYKIVAYPCANINEEFEIPDEIETIGKYAFEQCGNLKHIAIPGGVKVIENNAFYGCTGITELILPDDLTTVGNNAFSSCTQITSVEIDCENIGTSLFSGCRQLKSATVKSAEAVKDGMFAYCDSLTAVYISKSVKSVENNAFRDCKSLTDIYYEGTADEWKSVTVSSTNNSTFQSATVHYESTPDDIVVATPEEYFSFSGGTITGYQGTATDVVIPATIGGIKVTAIGSYAFARNNNITRVVVPNGVTSIGSYAFRNCSSLKTVKLPETVTTIGSYAFYWCESLESINIPDAVTAINDYTFYYCYNLKNFKFPASLTYIGIRAFYNANLETLVLPDKLETINDEAFSNCEFTYVIIPDSVKTIGYRAFYWSTQFEQIVIGSGLESIGNEAFYNCWSIRNVYYNGTTVDWTEITRGYSNEDLFNADIIYNYNKVTGISIAKENNEMWVGDRLEIEVTFQPENADFTDCVWSSSNENVAIVNENGIVTAVSQGEAIITATSKDGGYSASCKVTTKNVAVTGFDIIDDSIELVVDEDKPIEVAFEPSNATIRDIEWTTSDPNVVIPIMPDMLHGVSKGTATITGTTADGRFTDSITVTVTDSYGDGTLENGITWKVNYDGTLVISGNGDMPDYKINEQSQNGATGNFDKEDADIGNPAPWYELAENITGIYVEDGITSIGDYAFYNLYRILMVQLPDTLKEIGRNAFSNIWQQYEMDIPDSVETIGAYAFAHNNAFFITGLPTGLKTIGDYAFYYHNLSNVMLPLVPEGVTSIGKCAFYGTNVAHINIPDSVTTIGSGAFAGNDGLCIIEISSDNENFVVENNTLYNADRTTLMLCADRASVQFDVPSSVTKIDDYAFSRVMNLSNINISNSVKTIGEGAFQQCNVSYINLPEGLTSIGKSAFSSCGQLSGVRIPASIKVIPDNAFSGCNMLNWIELHDDITKIGNYAFSSCNQLMNIKMPSSLEVLGNGAFGYCGQLSQITLNDGLKTIGNYAFDGCMYNYIEIPASVIAIGEGAFRSSNLMDIYVNSGNQSFTVIDGALYTMDKKLLKQYPKARTADTVVVAAGTEKIENSAFNQTQVNRVILPDTVTEIGNMAFESSTLKYINLPDSITKIGYNAFGSTQLTEVGLPNNLEVIPNGLFYNCQSLLGVTVGTGTKIIESSAFSNTSLSQLFVNGLLTKIAHYAFEGSNNLNAVLFAGTEAQWNSIFIDTMNTPVDNAIIECNAELISGVDIDEKEIKMSIGETKKLSTVISDDGEGMLVPWWSIVGDSVAVDANGNIAANRAGMSVVMANVPGGYSDVCFVYVEEGGKCGENVNWSFDGNETLIISGTGDMYDYDMLGTDNGDGTMTFKEAPWMQYGPEIKAVNIENGVTSIGDYAFWCMPELTKVTIADTVATIGNFAFETTRISNINIPAGVTTIKADAFSMCHDLENITVDSKNTSFTAVDGILYDKELRKLIKVPGNKNIELFEIPATVTEIASYAAEYLRIKALIIPEGVKTIGEGAFAKNDTLMNVMLPKSLESIGDDAFYMAPIRVVVYGGSEQQFNELVPESYDAATSSTNPLRMAIHKKYNSNDKVHTLMFDCYDIATGGMEVFAEVAAFRPFTAVAAIYDSEDVLISTKVLNVKALSDFAEFDFDGISFGNGIKVRMLMLDSINTMQPVGVMSEKTSTIDK